MGHDQSMSADAAQAHAHAQVPGADLVIDGLSITFDTDDGPLTAVDNVGFTLAPGETVALVGESGCGKTVTALSILGLVPAPGRISDGRILFDGEDLSSLADAALDRLRGDRIAMIFQEPMTALNPVYSVGDQIAEVLVVHRDRSRSDAWSDAVELLARVGMPDADTRAKAYPHQLSGGMRQRAVIAMALACGPDVLIADEPTTALDVTVQAQILDLIMAAQAEMGMAVLFISHDLAVVSEIADRVLVMYAGRIVEEAAADELFATPLHPYTQGLIATVPDPGQRRHRLEAIPGTVPALADLPSGCRFAPRCRLASDRCRNTEPVLETGASGRRVACHEATP
jgi:oligopeptide/dipeptide ABC transporter ATP-binding protein